MRSTLGSLHSQILILYTFISLWMELNKRGRTRRNRESKKPESKHDVSTVDGIKRPGIKYFPGIALHSGKTINLVTLK